MGCVVGIDVGTSSTKGVLVDGEGEILVSASASYEYHTPGPGWVEQDPEDWWRSVCEVTRQLVLQGQKERGISPSDIKAVCLSGQMNGAVLTNEKGQPLRPAILWLDNRSERQCRKVNEKWSAELVEATGQQLNPVNTLAKLLWIRDNEPEVYTSARWAFLPKDWVRFRLTGVPASEVSDASATGLMDVRKRTWNERFLSLLPLRCDWLPDLTESPFIVGEVVRQVAEETGLREGTPVCAGGGDMPCLAVGTGCITPGIVAVGIGTAGHVTTFAETLHPQGFRRLWPMCHSIPGKFFWLGCSFTCGGALIWWASYWSESLATLLDEAGSVAPGSDGLCFIPWLQGSATPHPDGTARGGWLGLALHHRRAHMTRALMEGVAFDLRQSLDTFEDIGLTISQVRVGEGGSRSNLWRQILADVFGRDLHILENPDASVLGAAIIAGVGVGLYLDFETACRQMVRIGQRVPYDPEIARRYHKMYELYTTLYDTLSSFFSRRYQVEGGG